MKTKILSSSRVFKAIEEESLNKCEMNPKLNKDIAIK
jgi:hypothetical protein